MGAALELRRGARILVRLPNWVGDVLFCTPALAALRRARSDLRVTALVKPSLVPAVEGLPFLDEVLVLAGTSPGRTLAEARRLRALGFDAALVFPKGFREALLAWLAGIPERIGLATDGRRALLTRAVPFTREDWRRHHVVQFARVVSPLGVSLADEGMAFPIDGGDRAAASALLRETGVSGRYAVLHAGASKPPRAWHAERFAAVARGLGGEAGLAVILVGTPAESGLCEAVRLAAPEAVNVAGRTSLRTMAALIEGASLFLGSDSGPMHLAAAVGAPVVAVFGPGAPAKTAPYVPPGRFRVLYTSHPCSPCRQAFWEECRPSPSGKPPCIEGVHPAAVLAACLDLLAEAGQGDCTSANPTADGPKDERAGSRSRLPRRGSGGPAR
jgi:lipopolysaccharide heptosyltransferase II